MALNLQETFNRYLENKCAEDEIRALIKYFGEDLNEEQLKALIEAQLDKEVNEFSIINLEHYDVFQKTDKLFNNYVFKYAAVTITTSDGFLPRYFFKRLEKTQKILLTKTILPRVTKVVLRLSDGSTVHLNENNGQRLIVDNKTKIVNAKDLLYYAIPM